MLPAISTTSATTITRNTISIAAWKSFIARATTLPASSPMRPSISSRGDPPAGSPGSAICPSTRPISRVLPTNSTASPTSGRPRLGPLEPAGCRRRSRRRSNVIGLSCTPWTRRSVECWLPWARPVSKGIRSSFSCRTTAVSPSAVKVSMWAPMRRSVTAGSPAGKGGCASWRWHAGPARSPPARSLLNRYGLPTCWSGVRNWLVQRCQAMLLWTAGIRFRCSREIRLHRMSRSTFNTQAMPPCERATGRSFGRSRATPG